MRLGGRLYAAIEILGDIERRHRPAADALKDWGLSHRFAGSGDRAAIGNIVYDALRRKRSTGWTMGADTPRAQAFGALLLEAGYTPETLESALDGDRFAPEPLTQEERAALQGTPLDGAPEAITADVPDWCAPLLQRAFGAGWTAEGAALARRPPLDLRVNTLKATRQQVLPELADHRASPTVLAPEGVRIAPIAGDGRHPNVQAEPAFLKGWFEVQDEGSQVVAHLSGAEAGMQVLDYCAGAGGKTLALSAAMANRGQLYAFDSEKIRLAPIYDRITRSGARNIQIAARPSDLEPLAGAMDLVLVDAPCTGSGTWRRRPDAKWRLSERQLGVRIAEQAAILDEAARYVRPGGRLVYITCSVFDAENADQISAFKERRNEFTTPDFDRLWTGRMAPPLAGRAGEHGLTLTPASSGTDGFFFTELIRSPE